MRPPLNSTSDKIGARAVYRFYFFGTIIPPTSTNYFTTPIFYYISRFRTGL